MTYDIIGAGIGGLTFARALQQQGISCRIFEQAPAIQAVGAGINLANNAMQVYEKLGLREAIEAAGHPVSAMRITDAQLNLLNQADLRPFEDQYGVRNVAIHRARLQEILVHQLAPDQLQLDKRLVQITAELPYTLTFADGTQRTSAAVIAADGIHSSVRQLVWQQQQTRSAGQICWRGIVRMNLPDDMAHCLTEAWGQGNRFGFSYIAPGQVYWYALHNSSPEASALDKSALVDSFRAYHPLIPRLLEATPAAHIHQATIADLRPLTHWSRDRICLLGDAAHATTPNLGQGACQAIEDAYVLARCLSQETPEEAFSTYERLRRKKAHWVVRSSWSLGKMAHWQHPVLTRLRNTLLQWTPPQVGRRQSARLFALAAV